MIVQSLLFYDCLIYIVLWLSNLYYLMIASFLLSYDCPISNILWLPHLYCLMIVPSLLSNDCLVSIVLWLSNLYYLIIASPLLSCDCPISAVLWLSHICCPISFVTQLLCYISICLKFMLCRSTLFLKVDLISEDLIYWSDVRPFVNSLFRQKVAPLNADMTSRRR